MAATLATLLTTGPLVAFASVLAGSLGIPVPSLAAVVFVGSLLGTGQGGLEAAALAFAAAMAGAVLGDTALFFTGRRYGTRVLGLVCRLSLSRDSCVRRTAEIFQRRGIKILLVDRFLPGLSVVTAPLAGISGLSLKRFLLYAETGAALWVGSGLALGYCFAGQVGSAVQALGHVGLDLGGVALVLILAYAGVSWFRRRQLLRQLRVARITVDELAALCRTELGAVVVDARSGLERAAEPFVLPGAILFDGGRPPAVSALGPVVIYCSCPNEISAAVLAKRMRQQGHADVRPLLGGLAAWRQAGHPVAPLPGPARAEAIASGPAGVRQSVLSDTAA